MSTLSLHYAQPSQPQDDAVLPLRWSPMFATLVWSAVSAAVWSIAVGAGIALF
jgi:hypothetical protein